MKTTHQILLVALLFCIATQLESQTTTFTYQGRLNEGINPANGFYDLRFALYDAGTNGSLIGAFLTNAPVAVSNGLFTATLDFGNVFNGSARWLEIGVRTNGSAGAFTTLSPRQQITSTPYAIQSLNAASATVASSANSVSAANISGTIAYGQL